MSTSQAQIQVIFSLLYFAMGFGNGAAFTLGVSFRGLGRASMASAKTADTATRKMGVLKETKFTLFNIDDLKALFVVVHYVGQFSAFLLHRQ